MSKVQKMRMKCHENEVEIILGEDVILINRVDLVAFAEISWAPVQSLGNTKYLRANVRKEDGSETSIEFHRYIMKAPEGLVIDHINRNGLDNRRSNLRFVTPKENSQNTSGKKRNATSKYFGVIKESVGKNPKFIARVTVGRKQKTIGRFFDETAAALAYNNFVILNNINARLNNV